MLTLSTDELKDTVNQLFTTKPNPQLSSQKLQWLDLISAEH